MSQPGALLADAAGLGPQQWTGNRSAQALSSVRAPVAVVLSADERQCLGGHRLQSERPAALPRRLEACVVEDRKSTRLNSSHANISYAVFCLKNNSVSTMPGSRSVSLRRSPVPTPSSSLPRTP